jgi:predicted nucleotidyltransferase
MSEREKNIIAKIKDRIIKKNPLAQIILFGSHARGQSHKDSDWDILILLNQAHVNRMIEREYRDELYELELEIGEPISTFVFSKSEWEQKHLMTPLYQNIKREGVYL